VDVSALGNFFDFLWGEREGFAILCIGEQPRMEDGRLKHAGFKTISFAWPRARHAVIRAAEQAAPACDVYAGVNLFKTGSRKAENALPTDLLWADDVAEDDPRFTLIDSGGGKPESRHAYMRVSEPVDAATASELSRAVFSRNGGRAEGFDAARVLRVPGTLCHKTDPPTPVTWLQRSDVVVPISDLLAIDLDLAAQQVTGSPSDDFDPESLPPVPRMLLKDNPREDRSRQVFDFLRECREEGVSDADGLAAVLHHRPARARAEERFPKNQAKQDAWLIEDAQRILAKLSEGEKPVDAERTPLPSILIRPVADFSAEHEEGAEPLVGEKGNILIPAGGESMLYGLPGTNKTALSDDLAFHVAGGVPDWLGIPIPQRRRVLLVENEGPRALRRERLQQRLSGCLLHKPGDFLQVWEQPWAAIRLPDGRWRSTLAEQIGALEIDLVVIGPVRSLGMTGNGTLPEIEEFGQHFQDVRGQSGRDVGFLIVHHENRGGTVSGVWEGYVESLLHAQGRGHGKVRIFFQKVRWGSAYHQTGKDLAWSSDTPYGFEVIEKALPTTPDEMADLIVEAVRNMPGTSWTPILNGLPGTKAQRTDARDALLEEGRIVNLVEGENGTRVVLRSIEQGRPAKLFLPDDPTVAEEVECKW
jgi:hypothetical protein